ncbi:protein DGS1, mitochondrial-like [Cryptomeria japonica]|uniref:protein DGS1, mitochondrial-like n=1 Tax=Cryptomeria japonica TaxID=3369 RepID=UPI0027DA3295|nr:protein DGS1, mitochondrial-like [Cryptomeria japonica]
MILYTLDRLYKVTERHAKESGEWQSLHADILDLANPKLAVHYKLHISARMVQVLPTFLQEFDHCSGLFCRLEYQTQMRIPLTCAFISVFDIHGIVQLFSSLI